MLYIIMFLCLLYPTFFLLGSAIFGYKTLMDNSIDGFFKPLSHINSNDDNNYIFAYKYDNNHYLVVDNSYCIKKYKDTLIFYTISKNEKDAEMYGDFILYKNGITAEELRYYPSIYSINAQCRFNWFFIPFSKNLTVKEYEEFCIKNGLEPPEGVFYWY